MLRLTFFFGLIITLISEAQIVGRVDVCKIYGKIYIVDQKHLADYKVYEEETESFANLTVFKQENRFYADKNGQWFITKDKREADFWIYMTEQKGQSDFTIAYTPTESFAGCK
ncbi:MAG: hypothetical protein EAZ27_14170 [Cytophagales bacterium]|nr:MAG: hypothetical protein EAZ27_14170 [Cytophagales bacterium]